MFTLARFIFTAPDGVYVAAQMKNSQVFVNVHHLEPPHHFTSQASVGLMDLCFRDDVQRLPKPASLRSLTFRGCACMHARMCACVFVTLQALVTFSHACLNRHC